jgi:hypothetical protein
MAGRITCLNQCGVEYQDEIKRLVGELANVKRDGVIEGLERALRIVSEYDPSDHADDIRAELERVRSAE